MYVFSSKMANDATMDVRQKKYESIIAWHEANCRPSTSKCDFADDCQAAPVSKKKRRSVVSFSKVVIVIFITAAYHFRQRGVEAPGYGPRARALLTTATHWQGW